MPRSPSALVLSKSENPFLYRARGWQGILPAFVDTVLTQSLVLLLDFKSSPLRRSLVATRSEAWKLCEPRVSAGTLGPIRPSPGDGTSCFEIALSRNKSRNGTSWPPFQKVLTPKDTLSTLKRYWAQVNGTNMHAAVAM